MAWKGRSDLEKEMRKANDRLRSLESHGYTNVPAYKEALRQTRLASGDPSARVPRFRKSDFKNEADLRRALKKFNAPTQMTGADGKTKGYKTSTVKGVKEMIKQQTAAYQRSASGHDRTAGMTITEKEATEIGDVWEGIRKTSPKYDASRDTETQYLIERGLQDDRDQNQLVNLLETLRSSGIPIDDWEQAFDVVWDRYDNGESMTTMLIEISEAESVGDLIPEDTDED